MADGSDNENTDSTGSRSTTFNENMCVICNVDFNDKHFVTVSEKGLRTLIDYCEIHEQLQLCAYLKECMRTSPIGVILVHKSCHRNFTDCKRAHKKFQSSNIDLGPVPKRLRSSIIPFNWKQDCIIYGEAAVVDPRHPNQSSVHNVKMLPLRGKSLDCCRKRGDPCSVEIETRLHGCIDLVAAEAVYHDTCLSRFMLNKSLKPNISNNQGRPIDEKMNFHFENLCTRLESEGDAELYLIVELHTKMSALSNNNEVYSTKRLKQKLVERYGEFVFFTEVEGRGTVVCFKSMAKFIIEKCYSEKKDSIHEAEQLVKAAAKVIKAEIREQMYDITSYSSTEDITNGIEKWMPHLLKCFLDIVILSEVKRNSIGHCILQSARPKSVIAPIPFGLGVEIDHVFGSKWLINELSRLGFSISYDEVTRYKQSVIQSENSYEIIGQFFPGSFTQWVADNVDHNIATIDGQGTFHEMSIIAVSTFKEISPLTVQPQQITRNL